MVTEGSGRREGWTGLLLALLALGVGFVAMNVTAVVANLASSRLGVHPHHGLPLVLLLSETALVLPGLILVLAQSRGASLALTLPGPWTLLGAVGLGATLWVASVGLLGLQSLAWPPDPGYLEVFRHLLETLRPTGPLDAVVSVGAIAVVPALCEETLLRGIVLPPLLRTTGVTGGVVISALLFGLIHWDLYRFPFTFAMGIALASLRVRTGSLTPGVVSHALVNTITFTAAPFIDDPSGKGDDITPLLAVVLLAVGAGLSLLILRALRTSGLRTGSR